jgi:hypothetical protein
VEHTVPQAEAEGGAREGRRVAIVDNLNGLSSSISSCHGIVSSLFPVSLTVRNLLFGDLNGAAVPDKKTVVSGSLDLTDPIRRVAV